MPRFRIFDTNPLRTAEIQYARRGEMCFLCGNPLPVLLGTIEARNAADAVQAARDQWPHVPLRHFFAEAQNDPLIE